MVQVRDRRKRNWKKRTKPVLELRGDAVKLQVFLDTHEIQDEDELRQHLEFRKGNWGAFWWVEDDSTPVMGLFLNGGDGCVYEDRTCEWSSNPDRADDFESTVEFMIENGQVDDFPACSVIPASAAVEAFIDFYRTGRRSDAISWQ